MQRPDYCAPRGKKRSALTCKDHGKALPPPKKFLLRSLSLPRIYEATHRSFENGRGERQGPSGPARSSAFCPASIRSAPARVRFS